MRACRSQIQRCGKWKELLTWGRERDIKKSIQRDKYIPDHKKQDQFFQKPGKIDVVVY